MRRARRIRKRRERSEEIERLLDRSTSPWRDGSNEQSIATPRAVSRHARLGPIVGAQKRARGVEGRNQDQLWPSRSHRSAEHGAQLEHHRDCRRHDSIRLPVATEQLRELTRRSLAPNVQRGHTVKEMIEKPGNILTAV